MNADISKAQSGAIGSTAIKVATIITNESVTGSGNEREIFANDIGHSLGRWSGMTTSTTVDGPRRDRASVARRFVTIATNVKINEFGFKTVVQFVILIDN